MDGDVVSAERIIPAPPEAVFGVDRRPLPASRVRRLRPVAGGEARHSGAPGPRRHVRHVHAPGDGLLDAQHGHRVRGEPPDRLAGRPWPARSDGSSAAASGATSSSPSTGGPGSARAGTSPRTTSGASSATTRWPTATRTNLDASLARLEELAVPCRPEGRPEDRRAGRVLCVAMVPLSVLDLATVGKGFTPADALAGTTRLAPVVEQLGYRRLWVAEHHGMPAVASSAPAVLIGHLADATTTLRIGAGGVMLPNHAPLVIAEQFATLEALHPGRIDLGLGRAPGTDQVDGTGPAPYRRPGADTFPEDVVELINYLADSDGPPTHPPRSRAGATSPRCGCSARRPSAPSWPACSACPSPSPTTSPPTSWTRRSSSTGPDSARPSSWPSPTSWWRSPCCAPPPTTRPGGWPGPRPSPSCSCGPAGSARSPRPRRRPPTGTRPRSGP